MGCFDQSCVVSRLPISNYRGNKCYVLPIVKNDYMDLNSGPFCNYTPLCLPIEGEYNDYGGIENIVENEHTKFLEEFFGMDIDKVLSCMTDNRKRHGVEYNQFGSLMEALGCNFSDISKKNLVAMKFSVSTDGEVTHEVIDTNIKINNGGFDKGESKTDVDAMWNGIEKDVKLFLKENTENYPKYIVEVHINGEVKTRLRGMDDLCKYFNERRSELKKNQKSRFSNEFFIFGAACDKKIQDRLLILHNCHVAFIKKEIYDRYCELSKKNHDEYPHSDYIRVQLKKEQDKLVNLPEKIKAAKLFMNDWHNKTEEERNEDRETTEQKQIWREHYELSSIMQVVSSCYLVGVFGRYENIYFDDRHVEEIGFKESFIPEMIKFRHFVHSLSVTNSIIFPAHGLEQHGDREGQMEYLNIVNDILESEIKEDSEEESD